MNKEKFNTKVRILAALCVAMLAVILPMNALAYDFEIDGLYYNKTSESEVEVTYKDAKSIEYGSTGTYEGDIVIPPSVIYNGINYSVTSIGEKAFNRSSGLNSVVIPNSVSSIQRLGFGYCTGLTSIEIPNSVTLIGEGTFEGCESLTSIEIPNSVISIGGAAFHTCTSLTSIEIPNTITSIDYSTFYYCSSLTSIEIPNSVTSIGDCAFSDCTSLTSIEIPNSVISIGDAAFSRCAFTTIEIPIYVESIGDYAFWGCESLTSIEIPNSVTSIGDYAFWGCESLTSIEIPNSVISIGKSAFLSCSSLTSIEIPNSVTSIEGSTFYGCTSLISIEIPNSVTSIGNNAFSGCNELNTVICHAVVPPSIGTPNFNSSDSDTLYVPEGSLEAYQNSTWGSLFSNIVGMKTPLTVNVEGEGAVYCNSEIVTSGSELVGDEFKFIIVPQKDSYIASVELNGADVMGQMDGNMLVVSELGTLNVTFAADGEASLTVNGHESHSITHYYKEGSQAKIYLIPGTEWELYSLTFNGEDVTDSVVDNTYLTPNLIGANNLELVMRSSSITKVESLLMPQRKISIMKQGNTVEILNLDLGENISIYNSAGVCEYQGTDHTITLRGNDVYILRTGQEVLKFAL